VKPARRPLQSIDIDKDVDVRFLTSNIRGFGSFEFGTRRSHASPVLQIRHYRRISVDLVTVTILERTQRLGPLHIETMSHSFQQQNVITELVDRSPLLVHRKRNNDPRLLSLSHTQNVETRCDKKHEKRRITARHLGELAL
jgi:hypothetical protein